MNKLMYLSDAMTQSEDNFSIHLTEATVKDVGLVFIDISISAL